MSEPAAPPPTVIESWEVLDLLTSLVQKSSVVYKEDERGQGRYRLLEPLDTHPTHPVTVPFGL